MYDLEEFLDEYDENTSQLLSANSGMYENRLKQWFHLLDEGEESVVAHIKWLEAQQSWPQIEASVFPDENAGRIVLPPNRIKRLSAYMHIFRRMLNGAIKIKGFAFSYFKQPHSNSFGDALANLNNQLFEPFSSELRKYIEKNFDEELPSPIEATENSTASFPAADRVVPIDHNQPSYAQCMEKIGHLQEQIRGLNDVDPDSKEQALAELEASRTLITARRIRGGAILFAVGALTWIANAFAGTIVQESIITHILPILRAMFPGFL